METVAPGTVYLVGAGPGDPGLISLRAIECLQRADLVLYDGLVNPLVLRHSSARAERTCRMGGPEGKRLDQAEINQRLIDAAHQGRTVVRLKGGDPFIFGRGSEEAAALAAEGIPFEVIPGITAAVAAAEYAGISLTHRDHASSVAFVTGHENPDKPDSSLDYQVLANFPGTLVFYMGLHRLPQIVASLVEHGKSPQTPGAVISRATTPLQRTVTATLSELPQAVAAAELHAPSLIVIGDCVSHREQIAWFERRPLFGLRIGITRPEVQAADTLDRAIELGAHPVPLPLIRIEPPEEWTGTDAVLDRLGEFDWVIFTSANGVEGLLGRLWERGGDARTLRAAKLATIGPATAAALEAFRLRADLIPEEYRAEALAAALAPHVRGQKVLWARANRGRDVLPEALREAGASLEQVVVYRNFDEDSAAQSVNDLIQAGELDWIGLSSPSIARSLGEILNAQSRAQLGRTVHLAAISPVTSAAARECDLPVSVEASEFTWDGILRAIHSATTGGSEPA